MYDTNPSFIGDKQRNEAAVKAAEVLWNACRGDLSKIPQSYMDNMGFSYSEGSVSLLNLLNRVSLSEGTFEEFSEVVKRLSITNPSEWPNSDSILEIQSEKLLSNEAEELEFSEVLYDFSSGKGDMSEKMERFLKKVISSVYRDGVTSVTDLEGNPPNKANRYLQGENGDSFSGIFYDSQGDGEEKSFKFVISKTNDDNWQIVY